MCAELTWNTCDCCEARLGGWVTRTATRSASCFAKVELYTHNDVMTKITQQLIKALDVRLVAVHLIDSTLCVDAYRYLSAVFLSLSAMMQLELPHINVLSKIDMVMASHERQVQGIQQVTERELLNRATQQLQHSFEVLGRLIAELIEDYGVETQNS
eukprot:Skav220043  [mRNA]  locus=scaffold2981:322908:326236:- [translate_table: standard]